MESPEELAEIDQFFAGQGLGLSYWTDTGGITWADLRGLAEGSGVVAKYGRGRGVIEAARRARERYKVEQLGQLPT